MDQPTTDLEAQPDPMEERHKRATIRQLWQTIGAVKLANTLAQTLSAQTLRAMETVRDRKLYLAEGFETFDAFLDKHEDSPLSYEQFRRRINLLKDEGDATFDLLNSLNVPLNKRKLLSGHVRIEGDDVVIERDGGEDRVPMSDHLELKRLFATVAEERNAAVLKTAEQQRTIERKDKKLAQGERDFEALKRRAIVSNPDGTETGQALLTAAGALHKLREVLAEASDEEKAALKEPVFSLLSTNQIELSLALGIIAKSDIPDVDNSVGLNELDIADLDPE